MLHVEFDIEGSGMQYQPGDSVGVLPHNSPHLVQGLLQHLGQSGGQVFSIASSNGDDTKLLQHLGWPCTLEHALMCGCDLTSIPRSVLHVQLAQTVCMWQNGIHHKASLCIGLALQLLGKDHLQVVADPSPGKLLLAVMVSVTRSDVLHCSPELLRHILSCRYATQ